MGKRIVILQGHPDPRGGRLGHALADAYARGAVAAGHAVERVELAHLEFPLLRTADEWSGGSVPAGLAGAQAAIGRADHLVLLFPLWTGAVPALVKGFFEQVARPGFAFRPRPGGGFAPALTGKSARVVVTMGMPAFFYRWFHGALGVRSLRRGILHFVGIRPVRTTYIGGVDAKGFPGARWVARLEALGRLAR